MPSYNYACRDCGHEFDRFLKMDDRKIPESEPCPECGKESVYQMIGASQIVHERGTNLKVDGGFRDVMSKIKDKYKVNNIKDY